MVARFFTSIRKHTRLWLFLLIVFAFTTTSIVYAQAAPLPANKAATVGVSANGYLPPSVQYSIKDQVNNTLQGTTSLGGTVGGSSNLKVNNMSGRNGVAEEFVSWAIETLGGVSTTQQVAQADGSLKTVSVNMPGMIGSTSNVIAKMYDHMPVSSTEYVADVVDNLKRPFGAQPAYAQGLGFSSLNPVLELWKVFRDIAYFFFVVIFVVVGFLIMFRSKIGSQAAVTVQQALPKLIVSLLLVTFSYAIAGLVIDAMNIMLFLIIGIFSLGSIHANLVTAGLKGSLSDIIFKNDIFTNGAQLTSLSGGIASSMGKIVENILKNLGAAPLLQGFGNLATNGIFLLVLIIAIVLSLFRIFFALLQAYVGIFFAVIIAPFQLLLGALPGQNTFGAWLKGLIEKALVFPVISVMMLIAYYFAGLPSTSDNGFTGFSAPQLGSNQAGGFGLYQSLIALGAILAMPEVLKVTQGIMKGQLSLDVGALGKNLQAGWKGGEFIPGIKASTIGGVAQLPSYARIGSRSGEESGIERMLLGARKFRAEEQKRVEQVYDLTGKSVSRQRGGLLGALTNKGVSAQNARKTPPSPGAGEE